MKCGPPDGNLTIFDARSFSAATGNKIMVHMYYTELALNNGVCKHLISS